jgi:linoleoyl-CoA desaturase
VTPNPIKFSSGRFHADLRQRVDQFFQRSGLDRRGLPQMYSKALIIFTWYVASYYLLVFVARSAWQAVPLAVSLGLSMAGVGFNIMHDAAHGAFSPRRWVNKVLLLSLDLLGGSSYVWHWKHNQIHHTYPNIVGVDQDLNVGPWARLAPGQPRRSIHRYQQFYMWLLFGMLAFKWFLLDFRIIRTSRLGSESFPPARGWDLFTFYAGKLVVLTWAVIVPLTRHSPAMVLLYYFLSFFTMGMVLSTVFQAAHCVDNARFPLPLPGGQRMASDWATHQVETAVDFAPRSRLLTWYLGGLNYQIEHHLFPHISHQHYPAVAPLVQAACAEFGVRYQVVPTFAAAIGGHYRWMAELGRPPAAEPPRKAY